MKEFDEIIDFIKARLPIDVEKNEYELIVRFKEFAPEFENTGGQYFEIIFSEFEINIYIQDNLISLPVAQTDYLNELDDCINIFILCSEHFFGNIDHSTELAYMLDTNAIDMFLLKRLQEINSIDNFYAMCARCARAVDIELPAEKMIMNAAKRRDADKKRVREILNNIKVARKLC